MAKHANPALVGGFVVGAVVILVAGLLAFGSGKLFGNDDRFIAYFEGSVEGLDVGAPVKYRGVQVGSVAGIRPIWDPDAETIRIPVELSFAGTLEHVQAFAEMTPQEVMEQLVDRGLRAQLRIASFVTGKLYIELDFVPDAPESYVGGTELPEIPTIPSALDRLMKSFQRLPLDEIAESTKHVLDGIRSLLESGEARELVQNVNTLTQDLSEFTASARTTVESIGTVIDRMEQRVTPMLENADAAAVELRTLLTRVDGQVEPLASSAELTLAETRDVLADLDAHIDPIAVSLDETLKELRSLIGRLERAAGGDYGLLLDLRELLREMSASARSLTALTDYLQQRPEALISGKK